MVLLRFYLAAVTERSTPQCPSRLPNALKRRGRSSSLLALKRRGQNLKNPSLSAKRASMRTKVPLASRPSYDNVHLLIKKRPHLLHDRGPHLVVERRALVDAVDRRVDGLVVGM